MNFKNNVPKIVMYFLITKIQEELTNEFYKDITNYDYHNNNQFPRIAQYGIVIIAMFSSFKKNKKRQKKEYNRLSILVT